MYYILNVSANGVPNRLIGPGTWEACCAKIRALNAGEFNELIHGEQLDGDGIFDKSPQEVWYILSVDEETVV